jgi:hypothetical protein
MLDWPGETLVLVRQRIKRMKRRIPSFAVVLLVLVASLGGAVLLPSVFSDAAKRSPRLQESDVFRDGRVDYEGIRFSFDLALASEVKAEIIAASPASKENEGPPDTIYPRHVVFTFVSTDPAEPKSFIEPVIHVYPVPEYKRAFRADPATARVVNAVMVRLQRLLRAGSPVIKGKVPYLPIPDGTFAFRAHEAILRFHKGSGLVFLTQGQQDEMPINNQNLSYEFQGITNDGRYYVSAEFPAAAPFLAYDRDKATYEGRVKEASCVACPDHQRFMREYRAYAAAMKQKLAALPREKFQPSLRLIDNLLTSLEIDPTAEQ